MTTRAILRGSCRHLPRCLALALLLAGATSEVLGETFRVKTNRGTYLIELTDPDLTVKGDGDELVVSRGPGDEVRLKLDADKADRSSKEPALTIRKDGKVVVTARRISSGPSSPFVDGPGRTVLGSGSTWTAWSVAITPDGKTLVSGHQDYLRVWDMATLTERFNVQTPNTVRRVAVTPDGSMIASVEYHYVGKKAVGNIVIRDGKTGVARRVMDPIETGLHAVAIDPDAKVIVSSSWGENNIHVWEVDKSEQAGVLQGHTGVVGMMVYSPDGKTLISGGDTTIRLWDVDTGAVRKILRGHQHGVEALALSPDGKTLISGGFDNTARIWDLATGKLLSTLNHDDPVLSVAISPDGKSVATAAARWGNGFYGASPASVQVWDVATSKPSATLLEQPNQVFSMVFTPDGKSLMTASLSGALTMWDLATFKVEK